MEQPSLLTIIRADTVYRFRLDLPEGPSQPTQEYITEVTPEIRERLRRTAAKEFALEDIDPLNTIAVEIVVEPCARIVPSVAGLPDDWFEHDGQPVAVRWSGP